MLIQQIVNGVAIGCLYALVALGFTMIWNAAGAVNFAQGEFAMVAMFVALTLYVFMGLPFLLAMLVAVIVAAAIGVVMERFTLRPVRGKDSHTVVVVTLGVSIILSNGVKFVWGTQPFNFPSVFGEKPVDMGIVTTSPQSLWIIAITIALVAVLQFLSQSTKTGKAMRAVSQDREMASLVGVSVNRIVAATFGISCALAGLAGVLLAPIVFVAADIGLPLVLRALMGAVIGGFGSYTGALLGGLLIGVADNLTAFYISSAYRDVISFSFLILVLLIKPTGILGRRRSS